jgi:hypothetical protein
METCGYEPPEERIRRSLPHIAKDKSAGMYEAEQDPYCYPGPSVLINRLGIRDQSALEAFDDKGLRGR